MAVLWGLCCGVDYLLPFYYFFFFSGARRRLARPSRALCPATRFTVSVLDAG